MQGPRAYITVIPNGMPSMGPMMAQSVVFYLIVSLLVAYVTCSPHLVETQVSVTEAVRRSGLDVEFVDARQSLPAGMPGLGDGPTVQLWPHRHGTDAMFLALLRRKA